ncbi:MAG TPA: GNAT family N-acetyltransferase [Spirochaetota bacterium]|nr:GNAT family N-acetyltransferase [Spirochaetota bacterium]
MTNEMQDDCRAMVEELRAGHPEKFTTFEKAFSHIRRGRRIFVSTACAVPRYLIRSLVEYAGANPGFLPGEESIRAYTLGVSPYFDERLKQSFRYNSFFIGHSIREAVNRGEADYTPVFFSGVPRLFRQRIIEIDVALIQTSSPDPSGMLSLGVSIDIVKAAVENASIVIAQVNSFMPRVHGDTFISVDEVDFIFHHDEPLLEYESGEPDEVSGRIGRFVARIVRDGDTIQVGYGSLPNAIMANLHKRKNLGIHTELLSDGLVELIKSGAINNNRKTIDRGKTVATFCMGKKSTYDFLHDNPSISFHTVDYTNNPLVIASLRNITAINSVLQLDLSGQASAESLGRYNYSGIGGQADFMRGAMLAPDGRSILMLKSTAKNGTVSRIVPAVDAGAGVTLSRGDIHYIVTEYGIAYINGKNLRERALSIIAIAHPDFRPWLVEEAKKLGVMDATATGIPGAKDWYPAHLEARRTTRGGDRLLLRPVRPDDITILRDFFSSLSDQSVRGRFVKSGKVPDDLGELVEVDHINDVIILGVANLGGNEIVLGVGKYAVNEDDHGAELSLAVLDGYMNRGIGTEIIAYLSLLARREGLFYISAEALIENKPVLHLLEKCGLDAERNLGAGVYEMKAYFGRD